MWRGRVGVAWSWRFFGGVLAVASVVGFVGVTVSCVFLGVFAVACVRSGVVKRNSSEGTSDLGVRGLLETTDHLQLLYTDCAQ